MTRRRSESSISFFSFQDIIMSVVGIMILIALILILKLIAQTTQAAAPSLDITELQHRLAVIRLTLQEFQEDIAKLQSMKAGAYAWVPTQEEMDAAQTSAQRMEAEVVAMASRLKTAQEQKEKLKLDPMIQEITQAESRIAALQAARQDLIQQSETFKEEERELQTEAVPLRKKTRELDAALNAQVVQQLKVKVPVQQDKTAFILLYGNGVIDVLPTKGTPRTSFRSRSAFEQWIEKRNKSTEYFVVYVRPSRFGEHEKMVQDLKGKGFEVGLQVIGETTDFMLE